MVLTMVKLYPHRYRNAPLYRYRILYSARSRASVGDEPSKSVRTVYGLNELDAELRLKREALKENQTVTEVHKVLEVPKPK